MLCISEERERLKILKEIESQLTNFIINENEGTKELLRDELMYI
jgi:hypothetical protein